MARTDLNSLGFTRHYALNVFFSFDASKNRNSSIEEGKRYLSFCLVCDLCRMTRTDLSLVGLSGNVRTDLNLFYAIESFFRRSYAGWPIINSPWAATAHKKFPPAQFFFIG